MYAKALLVTLFASTISIGRCAPTSFAVDALLQNAETAQSQNAKFQTLKESEPCSNLQQACINGNLATCDGNKFKVAACRTGTSCFAIPNVRISGTSILCTSEKSAASIIAAAGGKGGITGSEDDDDCSDDDDEDEKSTLTTSTKTKSRSTSTSGSGVTKTVTVTATPVFASSVQAVTVGPAAASSLLASLSAQGFSVVSTISPSTSSRSPSSSATQSSSSATRPTITLVAAPNPTKN